MTMILVVDYELSIVELLSAALEEEGYQVMAAYNGQEGLACLTTARPDVVVCDVMMPVLDGQELCRSMQADPRYQSIPIVLMSAIRKAPSLAGCSYAALLEKPFDLDEVFQTIARLLPLDTSS